MPDVANLQVTIGVDTSQLDAGMARANQSVSGFGSALSGLATGAAVAGIAALGAGFAGAITTAAGFEKQISAISSVAGPGAASIEQLRSVALQLGKDTSFSASEAAAGMEEMVKAGLSIADVMGGGARAALDLAAAGGLSVAEAATVASNAMNAFGLSGSEMAHIADTLAGASVASATDVHQLGFALAAVGAVAHTIGLSFDDTTTAISLMAQAGLKGSDAGTSLKTMLLNLSPSTKKAQEEMRSLGIITADGSNQFFDAEGKVKSFRDISEILKTSLAGLTKEQQINALKTMFGTDAIRAAAIAAEMGAEGYDKMTAAEAAAGGAQAIANERLNNFAGSMEKFGGSVETAAIMLGSLFLPAMKGIVDSATEGVNQIIGAIEQLPDVWTTIQQVLAGDWSPDASIHPFTNAVGELAITFRDQLLPSLQPVIAFVRDQLVPAFQAAAQFMAAHTEIIVGIVAAFATFATISFVTALVTTIGAAIATLASPIVLIGAAIATLVAAWVGNWGGIREITMSVIAAITPAIQQLAAIIQQALNGDAAGAFQQFLTLVQSIGAQLGPLLLQWGQAFIAWIAPMIPPVLAALGTLLTALGTWITGTALPAIAAQLLIWGQAFVAWVAPMIPLVVTALEGVLTAISTWVTGTALPAIGTALVGWGQAFLDWLIPVVAGIPAALATLALTITTWITTTVTEFPAAFAAWVLAFSAWVPLAATAMTTELMTLRTTMLAWIQGESPPQIATALATWSLAFATWVPIATTQMMAAAATMLVTFVGWIATSTPQIVTALVAWETAFVSWIVPASAKMVVAIGTFEAALIAAIGQIAANVVVSAGQIGTAIVQGILSAVLAGARPIADAAAATVRNALDAAKAAIGANSPSTLFADEVGVPMGQGIIAGLQSMSGPLTDAVNALVGKAGAALKDIPGVIGKSGIGSATASREEVDAYIRAAMIRAGHDPDTAIRVSHSEGGAGSVGDQGTSFGPFQLHRGGLADQFTRDTGIDPSDPKTWPSQVDWVSSHLGQTGWGPWSGARNQGITGMQGINTAPPQPNAAMPDTSGLAAVGPQAAATGAAVTDAFCNTIPAAANCVKDTAAVVTASATQMNAAVVAQTTQMAQGSLVNAVQFKDGFSTITKDMAGNTISTFTDFAGQVVGQTVTMADGTQASLETMAAAGQVSVQNMGTVIVTTMTDMAGNVTTTTTDLAGHVIDQATVMGVGVGAASTAMWTDVTAQETTNAAIFTTGIAGMANQAIVDGTTMGAGVSAANALMWTDVTTQTTAGAAVVGETTTVMWTDVTTQTATGSAGVTEQFKGMADAVTTTVVELSDGTTATFTQMGADTIETITDMSGNIIQVIELMNTDTQTAIAEMATTVVEQTQTMADDASSSVTDMASEIGNQMTTVAKSFKDVVSPINDFQGALDGIEPPDLGDVVDELDKVTKAAQKAAAAIKKVGGSDSDDGKGHGGHIGGGGGDSAGDVGPSSFGSELVAPSSATKGDIVVNITLNGPNLSSSREMQDAVIVALESASARGRY